VAALLEGRVRAILSPRRAVGLVLSSGPGLRRDRGAGRIRHGAELQSFTLTFRHAVTMKQSRAVAAGDSKRKGAPTRSSLSGSGPAGWMQPCCRPRRSPPWTESILTLFLGAREVGLKVALQGWEEMNFRRLSKFCGYAAPSRMIGGALVRCSAAANDGHSLSGCGTARLTAPRARRAAWDIIRTLWHPIFSRGRFPPGQIRNESSSAVSPEPVNATGHSSSPTWLRAGSNATADEASKLDRCRNFWLRCESTWRAPLLRTNRCVSMARSLEVRVPLSDTPLVDL